MPHQNNIFQASYQILLPGNLKSGFGEADGIVFVDHG